MIRFSQQAEINKESVGGVAVTPVDKPSTVSARAFIREFAAANPEPPWVLLVGGSDLMSMRIRHAQSVIRYDERASPWSHIAIVLDVNVDDPLLSSGVEVCVMPPSETGPERNYISFFRLKSYAHDVRFPNLALVAAKPKEKSGLDASSGGPVSAAGNTLGERVRHFALMRHAGRGVHSFGAWVAQWNAFLYDPVTQSNPLLRNIGLPSAGYVDYAFAAAGLDLTPVAATSAVCPEHLWATVRNFKHPDVEFVYRSRRKEPTVGRDPLPEALDEQYRAFLKR